MKVFFKINRGARSHHKSAGQRLCFMNLKSLNLKKEQESNIRQILEGKLHPKEFTSVQFWLGKCFNPPNSDELKMCAFNQIVFGFGVESVQGDWQNGYWGNIIFTYVNMGFSDLPTIICHRDKGFLVDSVDNLVSKMEKSQCRRKLRSGG